METFRLSLKTLCIKNVSSYLKNLSELSKMGKFVYL